MSVWHHERNTHNTLDCDTYTLKDKKVAQIYSRMSANLFFLVVFLPGLLFNVQTLL